jgi:hypothetical protein
MTSPVIPANPGSSPGQAPESRKNKHFWTPAFAGVPALMTFCEAVNFRRKEGKKQYG